MKKIVSLFLVAIIITSLFAGSVYAEDFTIHSGVVFGDTKEDVKAKEKLSLEYETATSLVYSGKVAGYDEAKIEYQFYEADGKLYDALYKFKYLSNSTSNTARKQREELEKLLKSKYGEPINKNDGLYYSLWGKENVVLETSDYTEQTVWTVAGDNSIIVITLITEYPLMGGQNHIDYHIFTDEEVAVLETTYGDAEQQAIDDL